MKRSSQTGGGRFISAYRWLWRHVGVAPWWDVSHLEDDNRELRRQIQQLEMIANRLMNDYRGVNMLPPPELRLHVGRVDDAANYWAHGLSSSDRVLKVFGEDPGGPVLDWGCGVGRTLHWLRDRGTWAKWYQGCDTDPEAIAWLTSVGVEGVALCGDAPPLPYADATFAGLFSFSVLTHIDPVDHPAWFREVCRVLAPGGRAYLTLNGQVSMERTGSLTAAERRAFAETGRCYTLRDGHYKNAAFASEAVTRAAMEDLFEIESYTPAGYHNMDVFIVRKA